MNRTISTSDAVDAAVEFLSKQEDTTPEKFLVPKLNALFDSLKTEADKIRFSQITSVMQDENLEPGSKVAKLRELLG